MSNFLMNFLKCNESNVNAYHNINYNTIHFKLILFNMGHGIQLMIDDRCQTRHKGTLAWFLVCDPWADDILFSILQSAIPKGKALEVNLK